MTIEEILNTPALAGNELWRIALLFGALLVAMALGKLLKLVLVNRADKLESTRSILSSAYRCLAKASPFLLFTLGLQFGVSCLQLGSAADFVGTGIAVLFTIAVAATSFFLTGTQLAAPAACGTQGQDGRLARAHSQQQSARDDCDSGYRSNCPDPQR